MRSYDVAYVPNGPVNYYPVKDLQDMTLDEIRKKYIKTCAKANGDVSICSKCQTPCPEGKRAIQLIAGEIYNDPPIPLYAGKTLIERAREENMKRRAEKEEKENKPAKKKRIFIEGWYDKAMEADDPTVWVMETYNISRTKAKQKIYDWRHTHPEVKENDKFLKKAEQKKEEVKEIKSEPEKIEVKSSNDKIETKLESLMKLQEDQKKAMEEYMRLYEEAKKEYEKLKHQTDILCSALDIIND